MFALGILLIRSSGFINKNTEILV